MSFPRRVRAALVAAAVLTAGLTAAGTGSTAVAAVPSSPGPEITLTGSGWGHSVGMSQYGAYAMAQKGFTPAQILSHYYPGTTVGPDARVAGDREVRVGLWHRNTVKPAAQCGTTFPATWCLELAVVGGSNASAAPSSVVHLDLNDGQGWRTVPVSGWWLTSNPPTDEWVLHSGLAEVARGSMAAPVRVCASRSAAEPCSGPAGSNPAVMKLPQLGASSSPYTGTYLWGTLEVSGVRQAAGQSSDGTLTPVLVQPMTTYLFGIDEVPGTWGAAAAAQAITARTYAGTRLPGLIAECRCHMGPTPLFQNYVGYRKESGSDAGGWKNAVLSTADLSLTYQGDLAQTYYSSSHGGATEASEDSWAYGTAVPYLRSVPDPYSLDPLLRDGTGVENRYTSWTAKVTNATFASTVGLAKVANVRIVERTSGGSPKALEIRGWEADGDAVTRTWRGDWPARNGAPDPRGAGAKLRTTLRPLVSLTLRDGSASTIGNLPTQQISSITLAPFRDDEESAHQFNIAAVAEAGVTSGCAAGPDLYCPKDAVTRGQMASFLARARGIAPSTGPDRFSDIADAGPHRGTINALAERGIIQGSGGLFRPHAAVSRAQMASFLVAAFDVPPGGDAGFTDLEGAEPHTDNINAIAAGGITGGCTATQYCPGLSVSREQMASFLARAMGIGG